MLDRLFTYADAVVVTEPEEVALIEAAQAGDEDAYARLLEIYGPAIRAAVNSARKIIDEEEAQATALVAFAEVLASHDPHNPDYLDGRLAPRLAPHLKDALGLAVAGSYAFQVPKRSLTRYLGILKEADGDPAAARDLAPSRSMSVETFDAIRAAAAATSLTEATEFGEDFHRTGEGSEGTSYRASDLAASPLFAPAPVVDIEDRLLVQAAFRAVEDQEARIVELAYGFTEYDPVPDAEIAHRLGLTRPTVQRKRGKALTSMRKALGVTLEPETAA